MLPLHTHEHCLGDSQQRQPAMSIMVQTNNINQYICYPLNNCYHLIQARTVLRCSIKITHVLNRSNAA